MHELLDLIGSVVAWSYEKAQGIDSIADRTSRQLVNVPRDALPLTQDDRRAFVELLAELPPLSGDMNEQQASVFLEEYSKKSPLSWLPRLQLGDKFKTLTGIDCVAGKVEITYFWLPIPLEKYEKAQLSSLLPSLPPVSGSMNKEERDKFMEAYRALENRPSWEPVLMSEESREIERRRNREILKSHRAQLQDAVEQGYIQNFDRDHLLLPFFEIRGYISPKNAEKYLDCCGLLSVLESRLKREEVKNAKYLEARQEEYSDVYPLSAANEVGGSEESKNENEEVNSLVVCLPSSIEQKNCLDMRQRYIRIAEDLGQSDAVRGWMIQALKNGALIDAESIFKKILIFLSKPYFAKSEGIEVEISDDELSFTWVDIAGNARKVDVGCIRGRLRTLKETDQRIQKGDEKPPKKKRVKKSV